jgi:hypothetical protein
LKVLLYFLRESNLIFEGKSRIDLGNSLKEEMFAGFEKGNFGISFESLNFEDRDYLNYY